MGSPTRLQRVTAIPFNQYNQQNRKILSWKHRGQGKRHCSLPPRWGRDFFRFSQRIRVAAILRYIDTRTCPASPDAARAQVVGGNVAKYRGKLWTFRRRRRRFAAATGSGRVVERPETFLSWPRPVCQEPFTHEHSPQRPCFMRYE